MSIINLDRTWRLDLLTKFETVPISFFRNYFDVTPTKTVSLFDWLLSGEYRRQVEVVRGCTDKDERRRIKASLPCITVSGVFSKRSNKGLTNHSGFICIDLDAQDNPSVKNWDRLKHNLPNIPGYCFGALSASGKGMYMIIQIANPEKHKEHFQAIAEVLRVRGLVVDKQCRDVARLRGASFDEDPYMDEEAGVFTDMIEPKEYKTREVNPDNDVEYWVDKLISDISVRGIDMTDRYDDWYAIGQSLANEFGESGRAYFHIVSRQSDKYEDWQCDEQYDRCLKHCARKSIRTFFWYCKQYGLTCKRQAI
ncbi:PriCT-2 domain-containing protein [Parabacteroides sp. PF5-9]|uniref:PriCT-2 domain-containing protein n=1 Tax=Parabacteroides sp. PF5-9 TaxID=1742404 RepID=UPI002476E3AE|nr:PriCT-2 domain-containing protein [Parabacteroides sp. PF5-9]MDH6356257.1 hypothetical protein [Parabacteroides sp. PF5-9]